VGTRKEKIIDWKNFLQDIAKQAEPVNDKMNAASRRRCLPRPPLQTGNQGATAKSAAAPHYFI